MATVTFLWHLHQPGYRTRDGLAHAPWVLLHAGGAYATLLRALERSHAQGQVLNLTPTLLAQIHGYVEGTTHDPVLAALTRPASELDPQARISLAALAGEAPRRALDRYPRLRELSGPSGQEDSSAATPPPEGAALIDLQVLLVLAFAGPQAWKDPGLATLHARGRDFTDSDRRQTATWLAAQPRRLLVHLHASGGLPEIEVATSPYGHPILPLLIDSRVAADGLGLARETLPEFSYPQDARAHLRRGLETLTASGFRTRGCWPPEGAVSEEALAVYQEARTTWLITDEGILEASLGRPLRNGSLPSEDLYRPWRRTARGPLLLFRDRELSDRIGFEYPRWDDEAAAARDLLGRLQALAAFLAEDASIVIALDGENPWPHYAEGGGRFLETLFTGLRETPGVRPVTPSQLLGHPRTGKLGRLHAGSWIHGSFATWIGHAEKNRAWQVLTEVRRHLGSATPSESLLLAEGSDWFWWQGDDNPTPLAYLYDEIFRRHLTDACEEAGVEIPAVLRRPIAKPRPGTEAVVVTRSGVAHEESGG